MINVGRIEEVRAEDIPTFYNFVLFRPPRA
jgi:hypothetical protein